MGSSNVEGRSRGPRARAGSRRAAGLEEHGPVVVDDERHAQVGQARAHLGEHRRRSRPCRNARARSSTLTPDWRRAYSSSEVLYAGLMLTRIGAEARGRVLGDDPLEAVRRPDADAIALLHAVREQAERGLRGLRPRARGTWRGSPGIARPAPRGPRGARRCGGGSRRWSRRAAASGSSRARRRQARGSWEDGATEAGRGAEMSSLVLRSAAADLQAGNVPAR